jgi:hypothetical protein
MPFADMSFRSRKATQQNSAIPYAPMGDERFRQLMNEMSAAFSQADDGEEKRRQARERERQHEQWLAQRNAAILEIVATMRQHGMSIQDLL